ncbi:conserved Plasmodium protein, unknown function [Plasmodium knowlesi strain H]|uniref:WD repeat-containing protein n=3 Tax=Plasmodium knowlesi TaxID=5850 RepID=A0A5K1U1Y8_PLAKH|nr:conserved Plasmodium protein, unknown function [Plasmodium knowlesi strain H]OTN66812.1 Uncharacterized protein PKNOH_S08504700 [Plasmodium knowlesi]CAA9986684.1 conserved Plasmodium protein, unknown function [Plasmodium knowlesi strain H]SBO23494.1 conserved Plasmodium protein, unknown function [Plasmodium knowlesi strain H]SBO24974.1 conserved Plasmodium protein, unknown function [Plasmodium knowlesi strain H]VVS76158.1 conserved Plasmodium protein, unknown function [Plasmodium knowlesi s|eukprot:XP_002257870.1 hypothetical protein, conserved in Plasmodium species [Plasmodium knowlesi strain H]
MEFGVTPLRNDAEKRIKFIPEYVHGYCGGRNNILKFANRKVIYPVDNLVVVYDLLDRVQSIFAQHLNEVTLVRCRESGTTVLSAEESNSHVRIYLWDKNNFIILAKIKIKKKHFVDIEFLNDGDIFLLCKWASKLVCLVLSVERFRDGGVRLSMNSVFLVKVTEGCYETAERRRRQNGNDAPDDGGGGNCVNRRRCGSTITMLERRLMARVITERSNVFRLLRKRRTRNDAHIIANRKAEGATAGKSYFRKVMVKDAANFVQVKERRKGGHQHYDIAFVIPFVKESKRFNRLLTEFRVSVPADNNACVYNGEYMFLYVMKNGVLYERLRNERVSNASFVNDGSFSKPEEAAHFFSFLSMDLIVSGLRLCDLSGEGEITRDGSNGEFPIWTEGSVGEWIIQRGNSPNQGSIMKEEHLNMGKCVTNRFDNFFGDEISAVALVTCLCVKEGDDIDVVLKLQRRVLHGDRNTNPQLHSKKERSMNKVPSRRKKILIVGTKRGVIIIIDFRKPHKVEHLRKISEDGIVSIFTHQNCVVVLSCSGVLYFLEVPNYEMSKSVDIFCSLGEDSPSVDKRKLSTMRGTSDCALLERGFVNSFRGGTTSRRSGVHMGNNPTRSYTEQKGKESSGGLLSLSVRKRPTVNDKEGKRIICASCLLDVYTVVLGISNDQMILYNLISNESCSIYPRRQKINCFTLGNDHIFYNVERCLYKMSLVQYNCPVKVMTLTEGPISSFVFLSRGVLICGTVRGSLCFFSVSEGGVKVINKVQMKEFATAGMRGSRCVRGIPTMSYIPTIPFENSPFGGEYEEKNGPKENTNEVICSIGKVVPNSGYSKRKNDERMNDLTPLGKQISWLVLNRARNILLCATERCIYLFRIQVGGNEKVDLRYLRCLHFERTIVHVSLVQKYDNLFYVAVREGIHNTSGGNRYSYHLFSFTCSKSRRTKMIDLCRKVLFESTRLCPYLHPREERFGLLKDKVVCLLHPYTFAVYSFCVKKTLKRDKTSAQRRVSKNLSYLTSCGELTSEGTNHPKGRSTVCPFRNWHMDVSLFWKSRKTDRSGSCKSTIRQGAQRKWVGVAKREEHTKEDIYKAPLRKDHGGKHTQGIDKLKPKCEATLMGSSKFRGKHDQVKERVEELNGRKMKDYTKYKLLRNILQKRASLESDGLFQGAHRNEVLDIGERHRTHFRVSPSKGHGGEEKYPSLRGHRGYTRMNQEKDDDNDDDNDGDDDDGLISNRCKGDTIYQNNVTGRTNFRRWSPEDSVKKYLSKYLGVFIVQEGEKNPNSTSAGAKEEEVHFPLSEGITGKGSTSKSHLSSGSIRGGTRIQGLSVKPLGGNSDVGRAKLKGRKMLIREKTPNGGFLRGTLHNGVRYNDRGEDKTGRRSCTSVQACDKSEVCINSGDAFRGGRAPIDEYTDGIKKDVVNLKNHTHSMFDWKGGNSECTPCVVTKGENGPSAFSTTNQKNHLPKNCRMTTQHDKIHPGKACKHAVLRQMGKNIQSNENGKVKYPFNMCKIKEKKKIDGKKTLVDDNIISPGDCTNVYIKAPFAINSIEIVPDHR